MKVDVYYNLHKKCLSIRSREKENYGKVVDYADVAFIKNATFVVQPSGLKKTLESKVKNVHAFVRGELTDVTGLYIREPCHTIKYDPLKYKELGFVVEEKTVKNRFTDEAYYRTVREETVKPRSVKSARIVVISGNIMFAQGVKFVKPKPKVSLSCSNPFNNLFKNITISGTQ